MRVGGIGTLSSSFKTATQVASGNCASQIRIPVSLLLTKCDRLVARSHVMQKPIRAPEDLVERVTEF